MLLQLVFVLTCITLTTLANNYDDCVYPSVLYPIDLRVLGNSNGTARFSNIPDIDPSKRRTYSFNGCFPFGENAAVIMSDLTTNTSTVIGIQQQKGLAVDVVFPGMTLVGYKGENDVETGVLLTCYKQGEDIVQGEQLHEKTYKIIIGTKCACVGECTYPPL